MATIVWVDDEPEQLRYEIASLTSLGHNVITVRSAEEALSLGPALDAANLLIVDLYMPVDSEGPYPLAGINFIDEVKRRCPSPPQVIVVSAAADVTLRVLCKRLGVFAMLQKPLFDDRLKAVVAGALAQQARDV